MRLIESCSRQLTAMAQSPTLAVHMPPNLVDCPRLSGTTWWRLRQQVTSSPSLRLFSNTLWNSSLWTSLFHHLVRRYSFCSWKCWRVPLADNWSLSRFHHFQSFCCLPKTTMTFFKSRHNDYSFSAPWSSLWKTDLMLLQSRSWNCIFFPDAKSQHL